MVIISKKKADIIVKSQGMTLGDSFVGDYQYLKQRFGEQGVEKIEEGMKKLGINFKYKNISSLKDKLPLGYQTLTFILAKHYFNLKNKDFFDWGYKTFKLSFLIKLFARFFISPKKAAEYGSKHWAEYNPGTMKIDLDMKKKKAFIKLYDFNSHPLQCKLLEGYFSSFVQFAFSKKNIIVKETKCPLKNKKINHHVFYTKW